MNRLIAILLFILNCQSPSNPSLMDEFVHGEVQGRKRSIEQAFSLWGIRGQVDVVTKNEPKRHRIVFTDTCEEDFIGGWKSLCQVSLIQPGLLASCVYLVKESILIVRRSYYQNVSEEYRQGILVHEIGHCIGMQHSQNPMDVMYYQLGVIEPSEAELLHIKRLWPEGQLFKFSLYEAY